MDRVWDEELVLDDPVSPDVRVRQRNDVLAPNETRVTRSHLRQRRRGPVDSERFALNDPAEEGGATDVDLGEVDGEGFGLGGEARRIDGFGNDGDK